MEDISCDSIIVDTMDKLDDNIGTYNKPLLNYGILSAIFNTIRNLATTRIPTDLYTVKAFLLNGCANSMTLYFGGNVEGGPLLLLYTSFPVDTILTEETTFFALY